MATTPIKTQRLSEQNFSSRLYTSPRQKLARDLNLSACLHSHPHHFHHPSLSQTQSQSAPAPPNRNPTINRNINNLAHCRDRGLRYRIHARITARWRLHRVERVLRACLRIGNGKRRFAGALRAFHRGGCEARRD